MDSLYKLIIVDDEFYIRKGLESFPWDNFGFKFLGSATNGKNALELIDKEAADVVITDIKMPVMDGLELSRALQQKYPNCKIIILTGYEDFGYAKSAIEVGVFEYILKPIDLNELSNIIKKLKIFLDDVKQENDRLNIYEKRLKESIPYAIENFFKDIINNKMNELDEIEEKMDLLEISLRKPYFLCIKYKIDYQLKDPKNINEEIDFNLFRTELECYFNRENINCFFDIIDNSISIILNFNCSATSYYQYMEEVLRNSLVYLKNNIKIHKDYSLKLYTGDVCFSILALSNSAKELELLQEKSFYELSNNIFFSWVEKLEFTDYIKEYPYDIENKLISSILEGNQIISKCYLDELFDSILNNNNHIRPQHLKLLANQLLNLLDRRLNKNRLSLESIIDEHAPFTQLIETQNTFLDLKNSILKIINNVTSYINQLSEKVKTSSHLAVVNAIEYIYEHYNEKISLSQVADHVYLNASYLSIQFKKETGKKFIDFLREYRMEKAKELLKQAELKVYNVCEMVGYSKQQYFADSFKDYTGMTPMEYRQKNIF